jgi:hypothetical protein
MKFEAYAKRQFVTESNNINSLVDHHIWSAIKTYLQPCLNLGPWTVDHGLGLLKPFLRQIWTHVSGWGWITGPGSCAFDLGSGIGGGDQSILLFVDKMPHTSFQQLALAKF